MQIGSQITPPCGQIFSPLAPIYQTVDFALSGSFATEDFTRAVVRLLGALPFDLTAILVGASCFTGFPSGTGLAARFGSFFAIEACTIAWPPTWLIHPHGHFSLHAKPMRCFQRIRHRRGNNAHCYILLYFCLIIFLLCVQ